MRAEYTAKCRGSDLFPALLAAAYGLDRPTVDEVLCNGDVVCRPHPKLLPTGAGRDQQLGAMAEKIRERAGTPCQTHQWAVRGKFTFDGSPRQARWLKAYALPHAASYWVTLSIPALEGWMAERGEEQISSTRSA